MPSTTLIRRLFCLSTLLAFASLAAPNVLIILLDDMGYGDPGCYNSQSKIPTPNIDRLASEGMRFTDAHAAGPLCHVSRYGLLTGEYPFRTTFRWNTTPVIKDGQTTIASLLRDQGYHTAMVGKWHLGFTQKANDDYLNPLPGGPVDRGFDSYFGIRASTDIPPYFYIRGNKAVMPPTNRIAANRSDGWTPIQGKFWRAGGIAPDLDLETVLPRFTQEAQSVITEHVASDSAKPLMLYLAYPAPHTPWLPSAEFEGTTKAGLYGDFMHMVDTHVGKVLGTLADAGMAKDTLVIVTADNGPVWYDKDVAKYQHDCSGPLRGMKADAWENGHRMPFVVRWPGKVAAASISDQVICFTDIMATFADALQVELPDDAGPDSFSFLPVLLGKQPADKAIRGPIVMAAGGGTRLIRSGDWKYINALGSGGFSKPSRVKPEPGGPTGQLYNLRDDIGETHNLFQKHPERVAEMQAALAKIIAAKQTRP
ncbi:MAG: arylsulfatase A [Rhodothermales bacterium]|jgi:arylsulfatase A